MPEMVWKPLADYEVGPAWHDLEVYVGTFPGSMAFVLLGKKLREAEEVRWIITGYVDSDVGPGEMSLEVAKAKVTQMCKKLGSLV